MCPDHWKRQRLIRDDKLSVLKHMVGGSVLTFAGQRIAVRVGMATNLMTIVG